MAVTWDVEIDVLNLGEKRLRVTGTRTDDAPEALTPVWSLVAYGQVDTEDLPGSRAKVIGRLWGAWQEYLDRESQIEALLAGWEAALESDLDTLEAG